MSSAKTDTIHLAGIKCKRRMVVFFFRSCSDTRPAGAAGGLKPGTSLVMADSPGAHIFIGIICCYKISNLSACSLHVVVSLC